MKKKERVQVILTQKDYEVLVSILWAELLSIQKFGVSKKMKVSDYEKALSRIIEAFQTARKYSLKN